jgi:hypothetical protein
VNVTAVCPAAFVAGGVEVDSDPAPFWVRVTVAFARGEPVDVTTVMVSVSDPPTLSLELEGLMDADIDAMLIRTTAEALAFAYPVSVAVALMRVT